MPMDCGACNFCCTFLGVPDIGKAPRVRCWHTSYHGGCNVHHLKSSDPSLAACKSFRCVWLATQETENPWGRAMRPDQTHVMFGPQDRNDPSLIHCHVDPNYASAWQEPEVRRYMSEVIQLGGKFMITIGEDHFEINSTNF